MASLRNSLALLAALAIANSALAELPSPRLDRIYPLGLAAGAATDFEVDGPDLEGIQSLRFDQPGLSAEPISGKERSFKITVAADVPAGTYDVRVISRFGVSSSKLLAIQRGLTEVLEIEPNNTAQQSQSVNVNSAVNGISDGENVDRFRFSLKAGQRIVLDVDAQKLDSQLDAQLVLHSQSGKQLASSGDYLGRDPLIDFVAPADGDYVAELHDLSYRGGLPYRLIVSDQPHVENVFPRAVQRGQTVEVAALGRNLAGAAPSFISPEEVQFDALTTTVSADIPPNVYRFLEHPTDHSVLPTAATFRLNGFQFRPVFFDRASLTSVTMLAVDTPVTIEIEPNTKDAPQKLSLPAVLSGRFDARGDADWFEFTAAENGRVATEVYAERLSAQADPYLVVFDETGNRMQEFDDFGHRINAFDGHVRDPAGSVNVEKNKKYRLLVQDRYQRGGPRYQYVLTVRPPSAEPFVGVIHRDNPMPAGFNVWRGGAASLDVIIHHTEGLTTPVTITAEDMPQGLHFAPTTIPNDNRGSFVVWSDEGAPDWRGSIKLFANYQRGTEPVKQEVRCYTRVWNDAKGTSRPTRELTASLVEKAPFFVSPVSEKVEAKAGEKIDLRVQVKRLWPEFTEDIKLLPLNFPGNFQMPEVTVPAGSTEATVTISIQNGTPANDFTLALLSQAQVPFIKDRAAKEKPKTLVSLPSRPITIRLVNSSK